MIDLAHLPAPTIIEALAYEAIRADLLADFSARYPDHADFLESDPVVKLIEVVAYRELLLRQRVNDAAAANLLAFAISADLDHLAAFYAVSRFPGESDEDLKRRVRLKIQAWSAAGCEASYRFFALSVDPVRVRDASVDSPRPGEVMVSVLARAGNGAADDELLDAVRAVVLRRDVRSLCDTVTVCSATVLTVDIEADVWLYPDTPTAVFDALEPRLRTAHAAEGGLGWDLTPSWILSKLHIRGVHHVDLVTATEPVPAGIGVYITLGTVSLRMVGRVR